MTLPLLADEARAGEPFRHEAFFYAGETQFLDGIAAFVRGGVEAREPVLVVVSARKIDLLRDRLGPEAAEVRFADMNAVGLNPARIIPAWAEFVDECGDGPMRGVGEPISAQRGPAELVECQRHESLINVAFAQHSGFTLLCPYDTTALGPDVLAEARHSHPFIEQDGAQSSSPGYPGVEAMADPFSGPLPDPPDSSISLVFRAGSLQGLRALVCREATRAGLGEARAADVVVAVNEVASNSLCHAGGWGELRIWDAADALVCEVTDDGRIEDPLVGRVRPAVGSQGGRGLWIANRVCELVQIRSAATGTTVRMHFRRHQPHGHPPG
jgi:anti-sigma regulatory factor (Ser/Thr protein kinase)